MKDDVQPDVNAILDAHPGLLELDFAGNMWRERQLAEHDARMVFRRDAARAAERAPRARAPRASGRRRGRARARSPGAAARGARGKAAGVAGAEDGGASARARRAGL